MIFVGLMAGIFGKTAEIKWLTMTGVTIAIAGIFLIAGYGFFRETRPRRRRSNVQMPNVPTSVENAGTTNKLLPVGEPDYIPSVVENTTELLKDSIKR